MGMQKFRCGYSLLCFAFLILFAGLPACTVELQSDGPAYDPKKPAMITLFAPRNGMIAESNDIHFEWASTVPYQYELYVSTSVRLTNEIPSSDFVLTNTFEDGAFAYSGFDNIQGLPLTKATNMLGTTDTMLIFWAVKGVRTDGTVVWSATNVIQTELDPLSVVISEVCFRSSKSSTPTIQGYYNSDFVELYNTTDFAIDIGGWSLVHNDKNGNPRSDPISVPFGTLIGPKGFFVFANSSAQYSNAFDDYKYASIRCKLEIAAMTSSGFEFLLYDRRSVIGADDPHDSCNSMIMPGDTSGEQNYRSSERVRPFENGMLLSSWERAIDNVNVFGAFATYTMATPGAENSIWVEEEEEEEE